MIGDSYNSEYILYISNLSNIFRLYTWALPLFRGFCSLNQHYFCSFAERYRIVVTEKVTIIKEPVAKEKPGQLYSINNQLGA